MPIKRVDHLTKQQVAELEAKSKERDKEDEEEFAPPADLPPEALDFPELHISADNMAVAGSGSNWERAEGPTKGKKLMRLLREEVKNLHGSAKDIRARILRKQQEGSSI